MDMRHHFDQAHELLRRAERVVVVAHQKPDGDTVGAATGLLSHLRRAGKAAEGYCKDPVPEQYRYLPMTERFHTDPAVLGMADLVIVNDAGDLSYAGIQDVMEGLGRRPTLVNIDHHKVNSMFGDVNIVDPSASSTAEVMHGFLRHMGASVDRDIATALLTGIVFDTGNFTNPATTVRSLAVASDLLNCGARLTEISGNITKNKPVDALRVWGTVLDRLKFDPKFGIASTAIFLDDVHAHGIDEEHVGGISNFLNKFLDVEIVLVLKEVPGGRVNGSFRTASAIDVSEVAAALGGGGHRKAAGFTIPGRIEEMEHGWRIS